MAGQNEKIEPIMLLLAALVLIFTGVLIGAEWAFKDDAQIFQVVASILTGLSGAFMGRIKPARQVQPQDVPESEQKLEP